MYTEPGLAQPSTRLSAKALGEYSNKRRKVIMKKFLDNIIKNWKYNSTFFALGFLISVILFTLCIIPNEINFGILGYDLKFPNCCNNPQKNLCDKYDLTIIEPEGGYLFDNGQVLINGVAKTSPPIGDVWLMTISNDNPITYWPQSLVSINQSTNVWNGIVYGQTNITVAVVVLGENGKALFGYFDRVEDIAQENDYSYSGFYQLTNDIYICDKVSIRKYK